MRATWIGLLVWSLAWRVEAQTHPSNHDESFGASDLQLELDAVPEGTEGRPITAVDVDAGVEASPALTRAIQLLRNRPYSAALVRNALDTLADSGRYAELEATLHPEASGVRIQLHLVARKVVAELRIKGGELDEGATRRVAALVAGEEVTQTGLPKVAARVWQFYASKGYRNARVSARWEQTSDPRRVIVVIQVNAGARDRIEKLVTEVEGPNSAALRQVLDEYEVEAGSFVDEEAAAHADREFERFLHGAGWFTATVHHRLEQGPRGTRLVLRLHVGPRVTLRFERNRAFDSADLLRAVSAEEEARSVDGVRSRLREYYASRGYYDTRIQFHEVKSPDGSEAEWLFTLIEGEPLRVTSRRYPCLDGERSASDIDSEIDAVLSEQLPKEALLVPPAPRALGALGEEDAKTERLRNVVPVDPWTVYTAKAYQAALNHLRDLYRSEGYLTAEVGPVTVLRRACVPQADGSCVPVGQRAAPPALCPSHERPLPEEEPPAARTTCVPDPAKGAYCESTASISIPVKLGPRTALWDVEFSGNRGLVDKELLEVAELDLGAPLSRVALQQARRRLLERYQDEGYAFAQVDVDLDLSDDHSRGRARFVIAERERVTVKDFVVQGAVDTNETRIRERLELVRGGLYRRTWVRRSEEQIAALGVFSSVSIELEDPEVPAREKVVVVHVEEQLPMYTDIRPGFSTGEGPRLQWEFGHRNLFGQAIQLRLHLQVGYLPDFLLDADARRNFRSLSFGERLERRNTLTFEFPLAKRYRLALDGIDVRDNSRDYGITKEAALVTVTYRPTRVVTIWGGVAGEHNNVHFLKGVGELSYELARLLAYPDGKSFALALRAGLAWNGTDSALAPTRGASVSVEGEPVFAFLDTDTATVRLNSCQAADPTECEFRSRFIKVTNRVSGYIPFNDKGLTLALSIRWGADFQLQSHSVTYTDRLFFMGGADSLRGHLQASVIPQDIAEQIKRNPDPGADPAEELSVDKIGLRAGDFMINPRAELRIPLGFSVFQTAVFLDTGNLWRDIHNVDITKLRYTAGLGLRAMTPLGPLALDYGFKLDRRFYESDIGAFHFSVGWF